MKSKEFDEKFEADEDITGILDLLESRLSGHEQRKEEKEILEAVEKGEWQSVENLPDELSHYRQYAEAKLKKT